MEEKIFELYYKHLKDKLDLVFDFNCTGDSVFTLGDKRFGDSEERRRCTIEIKSESCGPYGNWTKYHIYNNGVEIMSHVESGFDDCEALGEDFYVCDRAIYKGTKVITDISRSDKVYKFKGGLAVIEKQMGYLLMNKNGLLFHGVLFGYAKLLDYGFAIISDYDKGFNVVNSDGKTMFRNWTKDISDISLNNCFLTSGKQTIPIRKGLSNFKVHKTISRQYLCNDGKTRFSVPMQPVRIYDSRYSLCFSEDKAYLYDQFLNKTIELGLTRDIEFSENDPFIVNKSSNKIHLIYEGKFLDVTAYFEKNGIGEKSFSLNKGITGILEYGEFSFKNMEEIDQIIAKAGQENREIARKQEEEARLKELDKKKQERDDEIAKAKEVRAQGIKMKEEAEAKIRALDKNVRDTISNEEFFKQMGDYKIIDPKYMDKLTAINLSCLNWDGAKIDGIDFRGTNLGGTFDPQVVYKKNLSGCNFSGILFNPFVNFAGVDIRGCTFRDSIDKPIFHDGLQYRGITHSIIDAITDETTLFNGIPIRAIFNVEEKKTIKH